TMRHSLATVAMADDARHDLIGLAALDRFLDETSVAARRTIMSTATLGAIEARAFRTLHGQLPCRHAGCQQAAVEMVLDRPFCAAHGADERLRQFQAHRKREKKAAAAALEAREPRFNHPVMRDAK